ncbi:MAG: hypothetical protein M0Z54_14405 [Thermaerobacter sp.]|nr:hypothetical protein [Thermaerobacter sp.]
MSEFDDEEDRQIMSPAEQRALDRLLHHFIDQLFTDFLGAFGDGDGLIEGTLLHRLLPPRYEALYTEPFVRKILVAAIVLTDRVVHWDKGGTECTAEDLAWGAFLWWAPLHAETFHIDIDYDRLTYILDEIDGILVEDDEYQALFVDTYDWMRAEDPDEEPDPRTDWFTPYYGRVHVYLRGSPDL